MKRRKDAGFTLAELLVVIAIIAILIAIAIPLFSSVTERAAEATDLSNVRAAYGQVLTDSLLTGVAAEDTVSLIQKEDGWQSQIPSVGGIAPGSDRWHGDAVAGGSCRVYYDLGTSAIHLDWLDGGGAVNYGAGSLRLFLSDYSRIAAAFGAGSQAKAVIDSMPSNKPTGKVDSLAGLTEYLSTKDPARIQAALATLKTDLVQATGVTGPFEFRLAQNISNNSSMHPATEEWLKPQYMDNIKGYKVYIYDWDRSTQGMPQKGDKAMVYGFFFDTEGNLRATLDGIERTWGYGSGGYAFGEMLRWDQNQDKIHFVN